MSTRFGLAAAAAIALMLAGGRPAAAQQLRSDAEISTKDIGLKEQLLGDYVADAIRAAGKADVGLIAASSFSESFSPMPRGAVTSADLVRSLDFKGDTVVVVKLTGDQLRRGLQHGLYLYPKPNSAFLQISGLTVNISGDQDADKRLESVKVAGEPLDNAKSYKVAMPEPLANGALAYFRFWKKSDIVKDTKKSLENAIVDYAADHRSIARDEDRIVAKAK